MTRSTTIALLVGLLSTFTEAIELHRRTDGAPRVVGFPLQRATVSNPVLRDRLRPRGGTVQAPLDNEAILYFANATLGTPAQSLRLHVDTGSSDLWVNTPASALCKSKGSPCSASGTYSANSSSTYSYISSDFNISYVDGSGAAGDYVSDTFTLGGITVETLQFGIGYTSSSSQGILGIGYELNEVQVGRLGKNPYNNLPAQLVAEGLITSNAYSLWLNDLDASTGTILFGGVDSAQFSGNLETLPIQPVDGQYSELLITLTDVKLGNEVIAQDQALAVLLDTGSSLSYLPDGMTSAIFSLVGATYDSQEGAAYVPCSLASNTTKMQFTFSKPTISVGMDELVINVKTVDGKQPTFSDGSAACVFGIAPAGGSTAVLGDTFIRSAYLVYDLANNEISMAQTIFNTTSSDVAEIASGTSGVPDATLVENSVAATGLGNPSAGERVAPPSMVGSLALAGAAIIYTAM